MKILIVNTSDTQGGAARAAYRLHRSLLGADVDSQMLVQSKTSDDFTVTGSHSIIQKGLAIIRPTLDSIPVQLYKHRTKTRFSPSWLPFTGMVDRINALNPDIVHLHWICAGMMRIEDIAKINVPIVWSLHDMWAFTGGCHCDEGCGAYKESCGGCKVLGSTRAGDLSSSVLKRKHKAFRVVKNLTIIGLSQWMARCAAESSLFKNNKVVNLPNPLDSHVFSPVAQRTARDLLNLPKDKKIILFGAMIATSDPNKGFKELSESLNKLQRDDIEFVVFGSSEPIESQRFKFKTHYLGQLYDDISLRVLYSAADVMVVPSLQEAFCQTAAEAMSCGTPVVAFGATGLLDVVDHLTNGYLAKPFDIDDLANGIEWVLSAKNYIELSQNARDKVMRKFDSQVVAEQYLELYKDILS
ncbi:MAG: glycosyltransferase family 4 protein [Desulfurivibrionaceae bacterium]